MMQNMRRKRWGRGGVNKSEPNRGKLLPSLSNTRDLPYVALVYPRSRLHRSESAVLRSKVWEFAEQVLRRSDPKH